MYVGTTENFLYSDEELLRTYKNSRNFFISVILKENKHITNKKKEHDNAKQLMLCVISSS